MTIGIERHRLEHEHDLGFDSYILPAVLPQTGRSPLGIYCLEVLQTVVGAMVV